MLKVMKTKLSKILAVLLIATLVVGIIPTSLMGIAETTNYPDNVTITVVDENGDAMEGANVDYQILDATDSEVKKEQDVETDENGEIPVLDEIQADLRIGKISVSKDGYWSYVNDSYNKEITSLDDDFEVKLEKLDVSVVANELTYNEEAQQAVTITGAKEGDLVTYAGVGVSTDGKVTNAGFYKVGVKIKRDTNYVFETIVDVTVKSATIDGITVEANKLTYNKEAQQAVTITGTEEDDVVTYSVDGVDTDGKVTNAGSYEVGVKITRDDNHVFETKVDVTVAKAGNEIEFNPPSAVTYNENKQISLSATATHDCENENCKITYTIENAGTTGATINGNTITYVSVGTIAVKASIPECDNYTADDVPRSIVIDYAETPKYTITTPVYKDDECNWYKDAVVIKPEGWSVATSETGDFDSELKVETEGVYSDYTVVFKDANGNLSNVITLEKFAIDKTAPSVNVNFKEKNTTIFAKIINAITFGYFCNKELEATVDYTECGSGVKTVNFIKEDENGKKEVDAVSEENSNVFSLNYGFEGTVYFEVIDNVGNTTGETLVTTSNSNIEELNGFIMIENEAPILSEFDVTPSNDVHNQEDTYNYSGDVTISFTAQDTKSGLYSVTATLNDKEYAVTEVVEENEKAGAYKESKDTDSHKFELTTANQEPDGNGNYKFHVYVTDNAGNVKEGEIIISIDRTSPVISSFDFTKADGEKAELEAASIEEYGYYFKEDVTVTVYAEDKKVNEDDKELVSGVDTITVVLVDNEGKYYTVDDSGEIVDLVDGKVENAVSHDVENDSFSFTITKDFKGQIYAMATDKVGNNPTNSTFVDDSEGVVISDDSVLKGYKHPCGSILESQEKHESEDHVEFSVEEAPYKTKDGKDLYNEDVNVTITVTDTYSGIRSIDWSVVAPSDDDNNQAEMVTIGNQEQVEVNDVWYGWKIISKDNNLVTKMQKTITVNNDSNDIVVSVTMTDRAGNSNTTPKEISFNIDKTAPEVIVEMNDDDDKKYDGFFKKDRTATITVKDRNFDSELFEFFAKVTDDNGKTKEIPIESKFKVKKSGDKPEVSFDDYGVQYYTYEMQYKFTKDGDYTFDVKAKDFAENKAVVSYVNKAGANISKICKKFTIDKTLPVVSVKFDDKANVVNGKYFPKSRTATVTIVEHNFDKGRVDWSGLQASLNGRAIADPSITWEKGANKNTHVATIPFTADGDYKFDVYVTDKANNKSKAANFGNSIAPKDFVIDQTITKPIISGIANGSAYKDEVIPTISFTDVNYDTNTIRLTRTRMDEVNVDVTQKYITGVSEQQGISGTFDTFTKDPETDGIYTLSVEVKDKAGNSESETYTFTVNRFGSVYKYSDELIELIKDGGQYTKAVENDIVITEYNAVRIEDSLEILVTRDGEKIDVDYTSNPQNLKTQTGVGSSGWYEYVYTIKASTFKEDGAYKISLLSKYNTSDAKNNKSVSTIRNSFDSKNKQVKDNMNFVVDSTAPEIRNIINLGEPIVNAQSLNVEYSIRDFGGLESVEVIVNGKIEKIVDFGDDLFNYSGNFTLEEMSKAQTVQFRITDLAGNVTDTAAKDFSTDDLYVFNNEVTVSTNFFVRWYANKLLFWGPIVGVVVLAGAIWYVIAAKKKKEQN